jgi:2-oxoglutarate dehydrogenase E1 component
MVEIPKPWNYTLEENRMILDRLIWSNSFEKYIASKYPNEKRFGLEGCEALIPGMKALTLRHIRIMVLAGQSLKQGPSSILLTFPRL